MNMNGIGEKNSFYDISPAAGIMGYTVKRQPHPLTEPSLVNFHLSSSPGILNSLDQSDHSRPETHTEDTHIQFWPAEEHDALSFVLAFITWSDGDDPIGSIHDGQWVMASLRWTLSVKLYPETLSTFRIFNSLDEQF